MSTTVTSSTRRTERPTPSTSQRGSVTSTIAITTSERTSEPTTLPQFSLFDLDTNTPFQNVPEQTSDTAIPSATTSSELSGVTCSTNSECNGDQRCSNGACVKTLDAAPFGPAEGSNLQPASHMSTGSAVALGLGVVSFFLLLFGLGIWFLRRRRLKSLNYTIEAPPPNRNRSASSATDQKTLVASLPNSPQHGDFRERNEQMLTASFAQLVSSNKVAEFTSSEKERFAYQRPASMERQSGNPQSTQEKRLPSPPNDMPLPPEPTEEKRYAINVNINKSMIFDDMMFNMASRDGGTPRDSPRMPKYRFEEYLPPVAQTPPMSIAPSKRNSEIEMKPYPRKTSSSTVESSSDDDSEDKMQLRRKSTLKRLESKPPQLPLFDLPPPSPSFSFRSYDWYQDIIGTEQTSTEDTGAPAIPDRSPARTPTKTTFGASLCSDSQDVRNSLMPSPLSPTISAPPSASHLHPSTAALASPTSPNFRLSPTVYTMPSRPPKAQPMRASLRSTTTQQNHLSRSWLPEDGVYLPEEGTHDSYTMFRRRLSDASRPTSYSPL
ncbi:hypothetical protein IQ06DRAFT_36839 [Phaeosphaeriaceae sp. SRC1lsM3a]|nr:hypothetical protein IQ06DRAFT_36839 [Stagonospora sp. SRC1lsM3a]